jgi:hypothetical protein
MLSQQSFFPKERSFCFLNLSQDSKRDIDWGFMGHGKLWAYNLNYFDYLVQPGMEQEAGIGLIRDFMSQLPQNRIGLEPYPISLRCVNWIKFLSAHNIKDAKIDACLFAQYQILKNNLEYHLLGNHLLENGFSLLFGAFYFRSDPLYAQAREILESELKEQILPDGGHFELSPMYHQIILGRALDAINLLRHNVSKNDDLFILLTEKARKMLGWLKVIAYKNGDIPFVNDAAPGIAPDTSELMAYGSRLSLAPSVVSLKESGYRRRNRDNYELMIDIGPIGPDYMPGHAHSDTFSFELRVNGTPVIVDTGVSTYEKNRRRQEERSTGSHNTVMAAGLEQSDMWGGFRVGRRARVFGIEEKNDRIQASHDGYKSLGCVTTRTWEGAPKKITITDRLQARHPVSCQGFLHFAPGINLSIDGSRISAGPLTLKARGADILAVEEYAYALGFNKTVPAARVVFSFKTEMELCINT